MKDQLRKFIKLLRYPQQFFTKKCYISYNTNTKQQEKKRSIIAYLYCFVSPLVGFKKTRVTYLGIEAVGEKMTVAVLNGINYNDLKRVKQNKEVDTSKLRELTKLLNFLSFRIKSDWHTIPDFEKVRLQRFAYDIQEPPADSGNFLLTMLLRLWFQVTGQIRDLQACVNAIDGLASTILECAEKDTHLQTEYYNIDYLQQVLESLDEETDEEVMKGFSRLSELSLKDSLLSDEEDEVWKDI